MLIKILIFKSLFVSTFLFADSHKTIDKKQEVTKSNKEKILLKYDKNRDGIITFNEIPKNMLDHFLMLDFNKNSVIEAIELDVLN